MEHPPAQRGIRSHHRATALKALSWLGVAVVTSSLGLRSAAAAPGDDDTRVLLAEEPPEAGDPSDISVSGTRAAEESLKQPDEPPPYEGSSFAPPPPLAVDERPAPLAERVELPRRAVELIPRLALSLPHCEAGEASSDRCSGVGGGMGLTLTALWRVTPWFAWGGALSVVGFENEPEQAEYRDAQAGAALLALVGRVYFMDEGRLDPYLELGVGGAALGTQQEEPELAGGRARYDETSAGPAVRAALGLDIHLTRALRVGPSLGVTRVFVDKVRRCRGGGGHCHDHTTSQRGHLDSYLELGANLTIQLGSEH